MTLTIVRCHSKASMTARTATLWITFVAMSTMVLLIGVLCAQDIVVQAADQFSDFGIGEELQGHTLQMRVKGHPQIVGNAFANLGVQLPLPHPE